MRGKFWLGKFQYWAPRVAYYFEHRKDPGKLLVRHTCDNSICVNPRHLVLGDCGDNWRDAFERGRASNQGSQHPFARLTEHNIPDIRRRRAAGETLAAIARSYGVTLQAIHHVVSGKTWGHVR